MARKWRYDTPPNLKLITNVEFIVKIAATILTAFFISSTVLAAEGAKPVSDEVRKEVLFQIIVSPVVRGAFAEAKKWAGAKKCTALQVEELSETRFKVYASCIGPEATGQFHVSGQILSEAKADSPVKIVIEVIEFTNAG